MPATVTNYDAGELAHLTAVFQVSGVDTDPSAVTADVRAPDRTVTHYTVTTGQIVKDSTGHYHLDVTASQAGDWWYQFTGSGAAADVSEGVFYVREEKVSVGAL